MTLAVLMKNARNNTKLSIRDVAKHAKVSPSYVHAIETGKMLRPKMEILYKLAIFYNIPIDLACIAATRVPQDCFYKILRCPQLLTVIRNYPE